MCLFSTTSSKTALLLCVLGTAPFVCSYPDIVYSTGFKGNDPSDNWIIESKNGAQADFWDGWLMLQLAFIGTSESDHKFNSLNVYRMVDTTDYANVSVTFEWSIYSVGRCLVFATYDDGGEWNDIFGELRSSDSWVSTVSTFADTQMDNNTGFGIKFSVYGPDTPGIFYDYTCNIHSVRVEGDYIGETVVPLPPDLNETFYSQDFNLDEEELEADGWTVNGNVDFEDGYVMLDSNAEYVSRFIDTTNYECTSLELQLAMSGGGNCIVFVTYDGGVVWEDVTDSGLESDQSHTFNLADDRMNQNANFGIKLGVSLWGNGACYYVDFSITGCVVASIYSTTFWLYNKTHLEDDGWVLSDGGVSVYYHDDNFPDWDHGRAVQTAVSGFLYRLFDTTGYTNVTVGVKWRASPYSEHRCRVWYKYVNYDGFIWQDLGGLDLVWEESDTALNGTYSQLALTECKMDHNPYLGIKIGATGDSIDGNSDDYCAFRDLYVLGTYDPNGTSCINDTGTTFFYLQDGNKWHVARDQESVDSNNGTLVCPNWELDPRYTN